MIQPYNWRSQQQQQFSSSDREDELAAEPVSEYLLKQDFYASGPNQNWSGDITYLRSDKSWLYLAIVIDLWSRAVTGWSMCTAGLRYSTDGAVAA